MTIQFFQLKEGQVIPLDDNYPGNLDFQYKFIPARLQSIFPADANVRVLYDWSAVANTYNFGGAPAKPVFNNLDFESINAHPLIDVVLIPYAEDPWPASNSYFDELEAKLTKPYIILNSNLADIHGRSVYYPFWTNFYPREFNIRIPRLEEVENSNRTFKYSSLSRYPSYVKWVNLLYGLKYQTVTNGTGVCTFGILKNTAKKEKIDFDGYVKDVVSHWPEGQRIFEQIKDTFPINNENIPTQFIEDYTEVKNSAFLDTYVNIVVEGSDGNIITERTLKPILAGQMFVMAHPGTLELLRYLGFDTFDDIIEHDRYVEYDNLYMRLEAMHKLLDKMKIRDWEDIFYRTRERRVKNRNLLLSNKIDISVHADLLHRIKYNS
jgi:hypothetical protein